MRNITIGSRLGAGVLLVAGLGTSSCAVNPATGERQLMFVSEGQEIQMGQEYDPQVAATFGLYDDQALQSYVAGLGAELAASSERPGLPWTFRVVDDPIVNAFALPGGFIYVSRGILAHFHSEAQLVSVLGHEIGHVTARHSASQMSQQQLAQIGLVAGAIFAPEVTQRFGGLAQAALGVLFLKFSRDDERQADLLGFRYMTRTGYDPREMPLVFEMLGRVTEAAGGRGAPVWLSTHPDPGDREQRIQAMVAESGRDFTGATVNRDSYLRRIDGLVYGDNPREGFFRDQLFLHPDLRFRLAFPSGWATVNQKQAVVAQSPNKDAILQLTVAEAFRATDAAVEFVAQEGVSGGPVSSGSVGGYPAARAYFTAQTDQATLRGLVTFIEYGGNVYRLLGFSTRDRWSGYQREVEQSMDSFAELTDRSALDAQPMRLRIVRLDRSMTLEQFNARYPSPLSLETLAILNQVELSETLPAGRMMKRVVGTPAR